MANNLLIDNLQKIKITAINEFLINISVQTANHINQQASKLVTPTGASEANSKYFLIDEQMKVISRPDEALFFMLLQTSEQCLRDY